MKRMISILITLFLITNALPLPVFAEDYLPVAPPPPPQEDWGPPPMAEDYYVDPEPADTKALSNDLMHGVFGADKDEKDEVEFPVPEDSWDGEYTDFSGKDGTTTRVFDNGSVYTTYPDGSKEGVDYKGNRYTRDKDGKSVICGTDGNQYIKNADGSEEAIEANGTHVYMNADGSSRSVTKDGFVFSRNTDGDIVSISVDGGETLNLKDENGDYITGEHTITGPNGKSFTLSNTYNDEGELSQFKIWFVSDGVESGMYIQDNDDGTSFKILRDDGTGIEATGTEEEKDDGSIIGKYTIISNNDDGSITNFTGTSVTDKDGNTQVSYDLDDSQGGKILSFKFTEDKDGNTIAFDGTMKGDDGETVNLVMNDDEISIKSDSGFFIKTNPKTGAAEVFDPETGDHIKINDQGEVEVLIINGDDGSKIEQKDGRFVITDPNGEEKTITIEKDPDTGETTVITSDGDTYTITGDGKVLKNGKELKEEEPREIAETGYEEDKEKETPAHEITLGGQTFMSDVETLNLGYSFIGDISPLAELTGLKHLNLCWCDLEDISVLAELTELEWLDLEGNSIKDFSVLAELTELKSLSLHQTAIEDISVLTELTKLKGLDLSYNDLEDISVLAELTELETLDLSFNAIEDISPLTELTKLKTLYLDHNPIGDYSPVEFVPNLYK